MIGDCGLNGAKRAHEKGKHYFVPPRSSTSPSWVTRIASRRSSPIYSLSLEAATMTKAGAPGATRGTECAGTHKDRYVASSITTSKVEHVTHGSDTRLKGNSRSGADASRHRDALIGMKASNHPRAYSGPAGKRGTTCTQAPNKGANKTALLGSPPRCVHGRHTRRRSGQYTHTTGARCSTICKHNNCSVNWS